jgi:hypothetical protein
VCLPPRTSLKVNAILFGCAHGGSRHLGRKRYMRRADTFITAPRDQNNTSRFNKLQLRLGPLPTNKVHQEHALISSDSSMTDDGGSIQLRAQPVVFGCEGSLW